VVTTTEFDQLERKCTEIRFESMVKRTGAHEQGEDVEHRRINVAEKCTGRDGYLNGWGN
jgi:hypothetical protein